MTATTEANLFSCLRRFAEEAPGRRALIHRGKTLAYGEFRIRVERRAAELRRRGIGKGDRIVIFVPMGIDLYEILLAVFAVGAVAVFLDAWADPKRLDYAAQLAEAKAYIAVPKAFLLLLRSRALRRIPVRLLPGFGRRRACGGFVPAACSPDDPALITFTTGSTGVPKAALRSCGFLWAQHEALSASLDVREGDVDLATLPIFALNNIACGVTTLIPDFNPAHPADIDPARIAAEARRAGVTTTAGSPAFYRRLAEAAREGNPIPTLRALHVGGAAVFPEFAAELSAAFRGTRVIAVYGSTEVEPIASIPCEELASADVALGIPAGKVSPFLDLAVVRLDAKLEHEMTDEAWRAAQCGKGEAGEICVAGDHVLTTYYRNPEAVRTNKIRVGGRIYHRTGDAGRMVDGRLYLLGRASRVFRTAGGAWCYPALVEHELAGLSSSTAGTVVRASGGRAVLVLESGDPRAAEAEAARLDPSRVPHDDIRVVEHIPRDPRHASKIDYGALVARELMYGQRND